MSNELVVRDPLTPQVWGMIQSMAPTLHKARLFGVASPEQAAAIMLKGHELGLSFGASFEFINVIQGKPTLSPRGALALIMQSPLCDGVTIDDQTDEQGNPTRCVVTMKRTNGLEYTVTFSMADAQRAGLVKDGGAWETYPANMLRWRAVGFCADVVFPDVLGGMKRADELGAELTEAGDVIEGTWAPAVTAEAETAPAVPELSDLLAQYGPEAIMKANDGKIPGTDAEIAAVAAKLEEGTDGQEG